MERVMNVTKELFVKLTQNSLKDDEKVLLEGWVRGNRDNGKIGFIEFNDGTTFNNIQLVYDHELLSKEIYDKCAHFKYAGAIKVEGKIKLTPENKQPFEVVVIDAEVLGDVDEDYPLQKKRHSFEFMRDIAYLRPRANTFNALFRVRNILAYAIHKFFQERGFMYVHTPLLTTNDAEGAGQTFKVCEDLKNPTEFFNANTSLTVSGQLHVEPFALTFRDTYTFGPTFRAEHSNTSRHASEFWMIEPEIAFADLEDDMNLMEDFLKYIMSYVLENCKEEMDFFNTMIEKGVLDKIQHVLNSPFKRMTYTEGIEILKEAVKNGEKFEYNHIEWGMDLQSEHERYLTEKVVKGPMFLIDYPKDIKSFYMKLNKDGKTVAACDLLVPGVGEICGGSQREDDYEKLKARMEKEGNDKTLDWYLNLRRYGGCIHSGFGLGFDRLLMYMTGLSNIRDVQPYPRTPGSIKY